MSILNDIVKSTNERIEKLKRLYNIGFFESTELFNSPTVSMKEYLIRSDKNGIIAEFKRKSPSKGVLNDYVKVEETTLRYMRSGCSALSILTEPYFFNGSNNDLIQARKFNYCPILRKDFIFDPIQIFESRSIGADCVLLIEKILSQQQLRELYTCASELEMEVIVELDGKSELDKLPNEVKLIGVNSRNLFNMQIKRDTLYKVKSKLSSNALVIAESGLNHPKEIIELKKEGFSGFLIGSHFMQHTDPGNSCSDFCRQLNKLNEMELV